MKQFIQILLFIQLVNVASYAQMRQTELAAIDVRVGKPYMLQYSNDMSNFSEIGLSVKYNIHKSTVAIRPVLSFSKYVYSSIYYFEPSQSGFRFSSVTNNTNNNKIEFYLSKFGISAEVNKRINKTLVLGCSIQPQIGLNLSNRRIYTSNGEISKKRIDNNPILFGGDINIAVNKYSVKDKRRFGLCIGVIALNGAYLVNDKLLTVTPYAGISYGFMK